MKKPPIVTTNQEVGKSNRYLFGDKVLFGFPNRTYFELYKGMCSSDKIYSVQTKDFTPDAAAVIYYPDDNIVGEYDGLNTNAPKGWSHIYVKFTADLESFLEQRGVTRERLIFAPPKFKEIITVTSNDSAFVNPRAFEWLTEEQVEELNNTITPDTPNDPNIGAKQKKSRAILAGVIALFSLLN